MIKNEYKRIPIKKGMEIILKYEGNNHAKYVIEKVIGYGGSSIVYKAICDEGFPVILKEFYPKELERYIFRAENNELTIENTQKKHRFDILKNIFIGGYKKHLRICGEVDLNHTPYLLPKHEGNGTVFIGMAPREGDILSELKQLTLHEAVLLTIELAEIIKKYHDAGYLHLDIKPTNIFKDEAKTNLYVFDFDSSRKISDVSDENIPYLHTKNWASYELKCGNCGEICYATDIYSIGAIFYWMLFDKQPPRKSMKSKVALSNLSLGKGGLNKLINERPFMKDYHYETPEFISEILSKTLSALPESRYQSTDEMLVDLRKLEDITRDIPKYVEPIRNKSYDSLCNRINRRLTKPFTLEENKEEAENWESLLPLARPSSFKKYLTEIVLYTTTGNSEKVDESLKLFDIAFNDMIEDIGISRELLERNAGEHNPEDEKLLEPLYGDSLKKFQHYASSGVIFYNQGDYEKAVKYYNKSLELLEIVEKGKADKDYLKAHVFYRLGLTYKAMKDFDKSRWYFQEALDKVSNNLEDNQPLILKLNEAMEEPK